MAKKNNLKKYAPVGIAVAVGAAILYFSRRASAAPTPLPPPGPEPGPAPGPGPSPGPSGGGGQTTQAPSFPGARTGAEQDAIDAYYSEWLAYLGNAMQANGNPSIYPAGAPTQQDVADAKSAMGIPRNQSPASYFADAGLDTVYSFRGRIGNGPSWQPWADAWRRMNNRFRSKPWSG